MKPIYVTIVGSRLYGTAKEESSDFDLKGLGFGEVDEYCGLKYKEQEDYSNGKMGKDNYNGVIYEIRRCFHLLFKGNPTVLEPFCVDEKYILHTTDMGNIIAKFVRDNMISKHFYKPYFGYHYSQIKEFASSNRVGNRKELFEKYGFDAKFSSHAYRLAKQCVMLMKTGKLNPTLEGKDKEIVMKMRNYEYSKEECLAFLNNNTVEMEAAYAASTLPDVPDANKVNEFVKEVVHSYLFRAYDNMEYLVLGDKQFDINRYPL